MLAFKWGLAMPYKANLRLWNFPSKIFVCSTGKWCVVCRIMDRNSVRGSFSRTVWIFPKRISLSSAWNRAKTVVSTWQSWTSSTDSRSPAKAEWRWSGVVHSGKVYTKGTFHISLHGTWEINGKWQSTLSIRSFSLICRGNWALRRRLRRWYPSKQIRRLTHFEGSSRTFGQVICSVLYWYVN